MNRTMRWARLGLAVLVFGCAGLGRDCSSCTASSFGADIVVVQMDAWGHPYRCWALQNVSLDNESQSDGIYWKSTSGNLLHISGHYNYVQVMNGDWDGAYREFNITEATCRKLEQQVYDPVLRRYLLPGEPPSDHHQAAAVPPTTPTP